MTKELKRVRVGPETDLLRILEDVRSDKSPRLIEREGEVLAVVIDVEDYPGALAVPKSRLHKAELLALAGAWADLDTDRMIDDLYEARHRAPPSPHVHL